MNSRSSNKPDLNIFDPMFNFFSLQKKYRGTSSIVVRPESTEEVSSILQYCYSQHIGVVPQAGNTGLVGGSVPLQDEVILSVERLNQIHALDETTGIVKCGAGCILHDLQDYAARHQYMVPVDLGSKGTCQVGGNVSTNAGGQYYYRYGSLHANVLGMEVVLADGRILDLSYSAVNLKDNTGYDLKHLFIGAEGTLGVITNVALLCPRLPRSKTAAFVACDSFDQVRRTLTMAKTYLGEILAAFEFMDDQVMKIVTERHGKDIMIPLQRTLRDDSVYPYGILIETQGSDEGHDTAKMEQFLETVMEQGVVVDGILAQDWRQVQELWRFRELCNPSVAATGYVYKYDVSLPVPEFPRFIDEMRNRLGSVVGERTIQNPNWGHVIDGNLHFNVVSPGMYEKDEELLATLEPFIFESVLRRKGSISAEHGLGICKNEYLSMVRDPNVLATMRSIKGLLDPNGILQPGKYLPTK
jgi:FAD/FMN-containing dehydrogenase